MKKLTLILTTLLASTALAACGGGEEEDTTGGGGEEEQTYKINPKIEGGSEDEQTAVLKAVNKQICFKNGTTNILSKNTPDFEEDNGDYIKVTTKQSIVQNKKTYVVELNWKPDTTSEYYKTTEKSDNEHDLIYFAYKGYDHKDETGTFNWTLESAECGEAHTSEAPIISYKGRIINAKIKHEYKTISFIQEVDDNEKTVTTDKNTYYYPSTFTLVDYEYKASEKNYSPYFKYNQPEGTEKNYFYVNVPGQVVYLAPDGNWGLIADGKDFLEIYAGSGTALTTTNFPYLKVGSKVVISGNVSQYCGNIQLGFITQVNEATVEQAAGIATPDMTYSPLGNSFFEEVSVLGAGMPQKQAISGLMNSLATFTGTFVPGTLKNSGGVSVNPDAMQIGKTRYTFQLQDSDDNKLVVAYDYHVNPGEGLDDTGVLSAIKAALKSGNPITVKGCMRYNGRSKGSEGGVESSPFVLDATNPGVWNIVPFLAEHISH